MNRIIFLLVLLVCLTFLKQSFVFAKPKDSSFQKQTTILKPGITRHFISMFNDKGPVKVNILEVDLLSEKISIKVGLPDNELIKAKSKLTNIVAHQMAFVGVNANYFEINPGNPVGTLVTGGSWITGPIYDRAAVGFSKDKEVFFSQVMLSGDVVVYRGFGTEKLGVFEVDALNTSFEHFNKIGLFTRDWDWELFLPEEKIGVSVKNGCINKISKRSLEIPLNGYVLAGDDDSILEVLKKRDCLEINWKSDPDWSDVEEAVSGGPYLLMDGQVFIDEYKQNIRFKSKDTYAPRTAIGMDKNKKLYLVVVDGRRPGYSVGLTLEQLARLLQRFGVVDAINLDGGGSSTLVIDGKIVNKISEDEERKISSALLVFYEEED